MLGVLLRRKVDVFAIFVCTLVQWGLGYVRVFVACLRIFVVGWKDCQNL